MRGKLKKVFVLVVFLSVISWEYSLAQETGDSNPTPVETSTTSRTTSGANGTGTESSSSVLKNITYGCLAGGALGSIIPGIGNVIGCAAGGFVGWLFK